MLTDVIEALDRRYQLAKRICDSHDNLQLLAEVCAFSAYLRESDPRLTAAHDDLTGIAVRRVKEFWEIDKALVDELLVVRSRLAKMYPCIDDSDRPAPDAYHFDPSYPKTLSYFDQFAASETQIEFSLYPDDTAVNPRAEGLCEVLQEKMHDIHPPLLFVEGLDELQKSLSSVAQRIVRLCREWVLFSRADLSAATLRLDLIVGYVSKFPGEVTTSDMTNRERVMALLTDGFHPLHGWRESLFGAVPNTRRGDADSDEKHAGIARAVIERVYEGVRGLLGTTLSYQSVVQRFKCRAERYDAEELRDLATAKKRNAENALTDRLARFAYDQGLNPITRPLIGSTEPDLLDPTARWTFYVEAKQYENSGGKRTIVNGMRQVWDAIGKLQGLPRPVREAFYVIFRRGGPRYEIKTPMRNGDVSVHIVLVDIAPAAESGSRQKHQPILIGEAELMPLSASISSPSHSSRQRRRGPRGVVSA